MTVSSTSNRVVYQGNGTTTVFPFAFKVNQAADLVAIYTDPSGTEFTLSPGQYTATGFGLDAGGAVTYAPNGSPIAVGSTLTLYRNVAPTQPTSISNQGAMWPQVIEAALDRGVMIAQGFVDTAARALKSSPTDGGTLQPLPAAAQRANSYLAFDGSGQPTVVQALSLASVSAWLATNFLPQTTAAAALAVLGGVGAALNNDWSAVQDFTGGRILAPTREPGDNGPDAASTAFVEAAREERNRFANGEFSIDQRNAGAAQTFTAGSAIAYCVDRWYASCTGANVTGQRVAGTSPNQYAYRFTGAASNTGILFGRREESANVADFVNQDVTVSLQAKSSAVVTLTWKAYSANAADDFSSKSQIATGTLALGPSLASCYFTFNAGPSAANGICIEFSCATLPAAQTLQFEKVALQPGTMPRPFTLPSIGDRLRECQRYLEYGYRASISTSYNAAPATNAVGSKEKFCVTKRAVPTITTSSVAFGQASNLVTLAAVDGFLYAISPSTGGSTAAVTFDWKAEVEL